MVPDDRATEDGAFKPPAGVAQRLLERDLELARLADAVAAAAQSAGGIVVVEGPPGIGKTSLLAAASDVARERGVHVLRARASELEREMPFGVVRQLFEPMLRGATEQERERLTDGAARLATRALDAAPGVRAPESEFATLHGLYWLLAAAADRGPLALLVDDLHWADAPSLRFLAFVAPRLTELPVLLACAVRPSEPGVEEQLIARLASDPAAQLIRPAPVSLAAATVLVEHGLGGTPAEAFARACHDVVAGNPLLLTQLIDELAHEGVEPTTANAERIGAIGPRAVSRTVLVRLARLTEDAPKVARALAVLGDDAELRLVAELAGLDIAAAAAAADELGEVAIVRDDGGLSFVHPIVRQAIYGDLPSRARADAHARAAQMLLAERASVDRVASHLLAADGRGDPDVVAVLRDAAAEAVGRGAPRPRWPTCAGRCGSPRRWSRAGRSCRSSAAPRRDPETRRRPPHASPRRTS